MSLLSAADTFFALRFLRLLTMPWRKTKAYRVGVVDIKGEKLKKPETREEKRAYTVFHRLVFNLRKLIAKVPGGSSSIGRYASALYLIREHIKCSDEDLLSLLEGHIDMNTSIYEGEEDLDISGCVLRLRESAVSCKTLDQIGMAGDEIEVITRKGEIMGNFVFEAIHVPSGTGVLITNADVL